MKLEFEECEVGTIKVVRSSLAMFKVGERWGQWLGSWQEQRQDLMAYSGPALMVGDAGSDLLAANLGSRQVVQPTAQGRALSREAAWRYYLLIQPEAATHSARSPQALLPH